jgi:integrase/recombinase XerD
MNEIRWERFPLLSTLSHPRSWLTIQADLQLAPNTIAAYGRALEDYLTFCARHSLEADHVTREQIAMYVRDLALRPHPHGSTVRRIDSKAVLANATLRQRLTAVRLYYDYLIEEGWRDTNPVGRGRYTAGKGFGGQREHSLSPAFRKLPWIPTDDEWLAIVEAARGAPLRNRLMLALAYDAALRREELCALETSDVDPSQRLLRIRAETTKNRQERVVPYSTSTAELYTAYLGHRRTMNRARGPLFLSESRRNHAHPLTIWTWSKVVQALARRADVSRLTTHTMRHICLTDLARAGWDIHEIARFAGHRSTETTLLYIHLSGRDLAAKFAHGMAAIHQWRVALISQGGGHDATPTTSS